jgi:hypothetical protein
MKTYVDGYKIKVAFVVGLRDSCEMEGGNDGNMDSHDY